MAAGLEVLAKYRRYFHDRLERDPVFRHRVEAVHGKRLECFCKPAPCHGDVLAEYLDSLPG